MDELAVDGRGERWSHAASDAYEPPALMSVAVSELACREPVCASAALTIGDAARLMSAQRISSLLVVEAGQLVGIVTDRDLRSRCLAQGIGAEQPIARIMSTGVASLGPESAAGEALLLMARKGIHHLPLVDAQGLCGLLSASDLMRWQSASAPPLVALIGHARGVQEIVRASARLAPLQLRLEAGGATPAQVGRALSTIYDAIVWRLIELAQAELGAAPLAFAWLACGSQGRHEQTINSDQDNALIIDDAYRVDRHGGYFERLAQRVNEGLAACGARYCPGQVMAANPAWRQSLHGWIDTFAGSITHSDARAAMLAANFTDLRCVFGDPFLLAPVHQAIIQGCANNPELLGWMVSNALRNRPPSRFFRPFTRIGWGERAATVDIKHRALIPISDIARIHALASGRAQIGTVARLRALAGSPALSAEAASELEDAFEYFGRLRLRHQAQQIRRGAKPDNELAPQALTSLERKKLKDALAVVARQQKTLAQRYPNRPGD